MFLPSQLVLICRVLSVMDFLKDGLTRRIIELADAQMKLKKQIEKEKLKNLCPKRAAALIAKGLHRAATKDAWDLAAASSALDLSSSENIRNEFAEGFGNIVAEGNISRTDLEAKFGKLTDQEWQGFDIDGVRTPLQY